MKTQTGNEMEACLQSESRVPLTSVPASAVNVAASPDDECCWCLVALKMMSCSLVWSPLDLMSIFLSTPHHTRVLELYWNFGVVLKNSAVLW